MSGSSQAGCRWENSRCHSGWSESAILFVLAADAVHRCGTSASRQKQTQPAGIAKQSLLKLASTDLRGCETTDISKYRVGS
ncbi:MAG: hypothetical protein R3C56_23650 [Pirellulaceae bacterium]